MFELKLGISRRISPGTSLVDLIGSELRAKASGVRNIFYMLLEVRVLTEQSRRTYNHIKSHSLLGYRLLALDVFVSPGLAHVLARLT